MSRQPGRGTNTGPFTRATCLESEAVFDEFHFRGGFIVSNFTYKGCIDILKCTILWLHPKLSRWHCCTYGNDSLRRNLKQHVLEVSLGARPRGCGILPLWVQDPGWGGVSGPVAGV